MPRTTMTRTSGSVETRPRPAHQVEAPAEVRTVDRSEPDGSGDKIVNVRLPDRQLQLVHSLAYLDGTSGAVQLRRAIEEYTAAPAG